MDCLRQREARGDGAAKKQSIGVKRQITPDSIMAAICSKESPLYQGNVLEAEFLAAEHAARKSAKAEALGKCQVCHLSRDKWTCREPLYLNALDQF